MTYPLTKSVSAKQQDDWESQPIASFAGGINTQERSDVLKPDQVIDATNLFIYKKDLRMDTGYTILSASTPLDSMVKRVVDYFDPVDGTSEAIAITKGSVYKFSTTQREWQYLKGTVSTDLNGALTTGATSLVVDSSTGFSVNDKIGVFLTNGKQYRTTITTVPDATHITIPVPGLPSAASDEGVVVRAVVLNGSDSFPVMAVVVPSNGWLVFTNNVDFVKRYNGTDCVDVPGLTSTTCVDVALYNAALFLLGTTESGQSFPYRIRRSEIGDPTTWAGGTAGFDDLLDTDGFITGGDTLGPYLIVYKNRSVYRGSFVNTGGKYYQFDAMLHGDAGAEGLIATDALINVGTYHLFLGNTNIYQYYGDSSLYPIGDSIFFSLFSADAPVNIPFLSISFAIFVEGFQEAWFFFCSTASVWPDTVLRYNMTTKAWTRRKFNDTFVSAATYMSVASFTWNDLVGAWTDQTWAWNSKISSGVNRPNIVLCSSSIQNSFWVDNLGNFLVTETGDFLVVSERPQVFLYDFITQGDNQIQPTALIETRDFVWRGGKLRTDRIDVYLQGLNILVQYSIDQGITWNPWDTISQGTFDLVQSFRQVVATTLRYRFTCADPNFMMRWMNLVWQPESVY